MEWTPMLHPRPSRRLAAGFTLIELLVVIAIIAVSDRTVAASRAIRAREAARRAQCTNNLKQIGLAFMNYESSNGSFSPTTILVPCPNVAPGGQHQLDVWGIPVVLECVRAVASVHGAVADVQRDQLRQHIQRRIQHDRLVHSS